MTDTVAAISTALSPAGIAVIRLSGPESRTLAAALFYLQKGSPIEFEPRKMTLGTFHGGNLNERCLAVWFRAPNSYTGEDVVEFQVHGGVAVAEEVLNACLLSGARLADPGEFTRRAFLNGKLTLSQAEGTIDTINAASEAEIRASYHLVSGGLSKKIEDVRRDLLCAISAIEVHLDYPEEDLDAVTREETNRAIDAAADKIDALLSTRKTGMIVKDGLGVALLGKPNVGKSSLLNALLGVKRAIVTDIAGTTRDHINETIVHRGVKINLTDTAGLRDSSDPIESFGIADTRRIAAGCDLAVILIDGTYNDDDRAIVDSVRAPRLIVQNKGDAAPPRVPIADMIVSAKTGDGIDALKDRIYELYLNERTVTGGEILTNARHAAALTAARAALASAKAAPALDLVPIDLRDAVAHLGKIDGAAVSKDVTDDIFSKFCLGK